MKLSNKDRLHPSIFHFREAIESDIPELARICAKEGQPIEFWNARLFGYLKNEFNPFQALDSRVIFVAIREGIPVGFVAGHITRRSDYPGHVQWIGVSPEYQRMGIGSELVWILAGWFVERQITKVRADVDIEFIGSSDFFNYHKAQLQNKRWLCWEDIRTILSKQ